mmetsp:Transcript_35348/g.60538  ORF Transcript_35348/g.60538 Transcript_35348/m.60538 type:complete len:740 (+) Transcript_35348:35-2254(+)
MSIKSILVRHPAEDKPVVTELINSLVESDFEVKIIHGKKDQTVTEASFVPSGDSLEGDVVIARFLARHCSSTLNGTDSYAASQIDQWVSFADSILATGGNPKQLSGLLNQVNNHLALRTYFVEPFLTFADVCIWVALQKCIKQTIHCKKVITQFQFLNRWFLFLNKQEAFSTIFDNHFGAKPVEKTPKEKKQGINVGHTGGYLKLENAENVEQVVTRFPPEPSGYLHIGHAKAALLNYHYAKQYNGKLLIRFDDTNPAKEKEEYMENILADLKTLEIPGGDKVTYTSDYFDIIEKKAEEAIRNGDAYVDNAALEVIREARMNGDVTPARDNSIEENLRLWEEMKKGSEEGCKCILRGKMESEYGPMKNPNKALRDPALYRVIPDADHARVGKKYKAYPLYDWACPIVDSIEGVTHALRTNEYHDRNPLYYWVLEVCKLRKVYIEDYSRLNFAYTVLSKRKLQMFVDNGKVEGWYDPSFPTIQGVIRRGLTLDALREFVISQGSSKSANLMHMDKLWAINKKVLDPIVPRHTAVDAESKCIVNISSVKEQTHKSILKHKKNESLGEKEIYYSDKIYIERADANSVTEGEEVTLMDWGNCYFKKLHKDSDGNVIEIDAELHLEGSVKDTKKKLTWLDSKSDLVNVIVKEYDSLINVPKIPADGNFDDFVNETIEYRTNLLGDCNLKNLKQGESIQLERRGYFRCDKDLSQGQLELVMIPDGKTKSMSVLGSKVAKINHRAN